MFQLPSFMQSSGHSRQPSSPQTSAKASRLRGATVVEAVCPYCAVGCGQLIYTKGGQLIDIEGDPRSPINEGTLCPKGANAFQLAVNPHRVTAGPVPRPLLGPVGDEAARLGDGPDRREGQGGPRGRLHPRPTSEGERVNAVHNGRHPRRGDARRRGELPDEEAVLGGARRGLGREPGPDMTLRLGARSGRLVRPRRGHQLPARPGQLGLRPDHGLEHGRGPSRRLPLAHEGQGEGRDPDPRRPPVLPDLGPLRPLRRHPRRHRHRLPRRPSSATSSRTTAGSRSTSWPTPTPRSIIEEGFRDTEDLERPVQRLRPRDQDLRRRRRATGATRARARSTRAGRPATRQKHQARPGGRSTATSARWAMTDAGRRRRRATRPCSTRGASCSSSGGTSPGTRPRSSRDLRLLGRGDRRGSPSCSATTRGGSGPRRSSTRSAGPSTPPACRSIRCAGILQLLLGNMGRPGGGDHGDARAFQHPGLDRRADPLRPPARLPPPARRPTRTTRRSTSYVEHEGLPTGYWSNFREFIVSLLKAWYGDAATPGERLRLRLAPPARRRLLAAADLRPDVAGAR